MGCYKEGDVIEVRGTWGITFLRAAKKSNGCKGCYYHNYWKYKITGRGKISPIGNNKCTAKPAPISFKTICYREHQDLIFVLEKES